MAFKRIVDNDTDFNNINSSFLCLHIYRNTALYTYIVQFTRCERVPSDRSAFLLVIGRLNFSVGMIGCFGSLPKKRICVLLDSNKPVP